MKRRSFITKSAAASFGFQIVPSYVVRAKDGEQTPNNKIRLGVIGCGGQGGGDLRQMAPECDVVALTDVDERRAAGSFNKHPQAKRYKDFRKMFDAQADELDAVLVATPDHTHYVAVMAALEANKHVYCEKPLAHSVAEIRSMRKKALEKKVITQVGNQGNSSESIRVFCELIWGGAIGDVTEVNMGCDAFKHVYCQIGKKAQFGQKHDVPKELDWDQWLGPAAERAYHPAYLPFNWRGYSAFGSGCIGDWICHVLDPSFMALKLDMPTSVTAEVKGYDPKADVDFYPAGTKITFEFPARGDRPAVKIHWHDGAFRIPRPDALEEGRKMHGTGAAVIGTKGTITHGSHGAGGVRIVPEEQMKAFGRPEKKLARVPEGHYKGWLKMIRDGEQRGSSFEYGGAMSEVGMLGMIAIQFPGTRLEWDGKAMRFTNHDDANKLVTPNYRAPWKFS